MKKFNVILFDIDGTIADTDALLIKAMYKLYDLYRDGNRSPYAKVITFSGPPIEETLQFEFAYMDVNFMFEEFKKYFEVLYETDLKDFPNCRKMTESLIKKGYKLGIITNKKHNSAIYCLKAMGYDKYYDVIVGFDDVEKPKPNGEPIKKAMLFFGETNTSKVLYVGDNASDYVCAKDAGVKSMIVTWGPREFPKNLKPDYFLNDFAELEEMIEHE